MTSYPSISVKRSCSWLRHDHRLSWVRVRKVRASPATVVSKQCCDIDYNNLRFVLESMDHKFWGMWRNISRNTFSTFSVDPTVSSSRRNTISFFGDRTLMEYLVKIRQLILRIVIAVLIPLRVSSSGDVYFVNIKNVGIAVKNLKSAYKYKNYKILAKKIPSNDSVKGNYKSVSVSRNNIQCFNGIVLQQCKWKTPVARTILLKTTER